MQFFEQKDSELIFRENGETLVITPWGPDSLRVRSTFLGDIRPGSDALLETEPAGDVQIEIGAWDASIRNGSIIAQLHVQEWGRALQITFKNADGRILLQEITNGGALEKKARLFQPLPGVGYRLKASFISDPEEKIFGMGQYQQERMDLKGCILELAHRNSQASVPFMLPSKGYGFLWNNAGIGAVHFGLNVTEWICESTHQLDYWITTGDNPAQIEAHYAKVVGTVPMMPEYGLGFWQCKLRYYNQEQVLEIARKYHELGVPVDVLVIDYYHWLRCGDWKFDPEYFPDPEPMVRELHDLGIETMVSIWPQVDWRSENYDEMKQQGLLVRVGSGVDVQMDFHGNNVFMDPTNPRTRAYVWNKIKENYGSLGIRTFWLDEAEPEFRGYAYENYHYAAGSVLEKGNIYPREYARMFYEGQKAEGQEDIVNLIRCAWVGSQRYGALVWSGDIMSTYEDFRKQICAGLNMGLAGIPWWTTDIGGFHNGNVEEESFRKLLIRWFEYGTFCPVMRIHGSRNPHEQIVDRSGEVREWTGAPNEIWSYGEENFHIMKRYIFLREAMRDYTRSVMAEAHETGAPVMRTLFYEFPEDKAAWEIKDQYLFGADILVAPVCYEDAYDRAVYLPAGASWTYVPTGEVFEGGQTVTVDAPLDVIPLFLRDGRQPWLIYAWNRLQKEEQE